MHTPHTHINPSHMGVIYNWLSSIIDLLFMFDFLYMCQKKSKYLRSISAINMASAQTSLLFLFVDTVHIRIIRFANTPMVQRSDFNWNWVVFGNRIESNQIKSNRCIFMFYIHIYTFHLIDLVQVLLQLCIIHSFHSYSYSYSIAFHTIVQQRREEKSKEKCW